MKKYLSLLFIVISLDAFSISKKEVYHLLIKHEIKCRETVYRQIIWESGHLKSKKARNDKNILGIKRGTRYCKYKSYEACIKDYKKRVQYKYKDSTENYYKFLKRIGYAEDKKYIKGLKSLKVKNIVNKWESEWWTDRNNTRKISCSL